ncbi:unnamed protein product [Withania somnifera]
MSPRCTESTDEPYGVRVWRTIRNLWTRMEENVFIKVGNGSKTKYWKDVWIDQAPLRELFPDLFQICENQDANVVYCSTSESVSLHHKLELDNARTYLRSFELLDQERW